MREALEAWTSEFFVFAWCSDEDCPKFVFGPFGNALKFALGEATAGPPGREVVRQGSGTSGKRMEVVDVASTSLVAQTTRRRKDPQEEIGGEV